MAFVYVNSDGKYAAFANITTRAGKRETIYFVDDLDHATVFETPPKRTPLNQSEYSKLEHCSPTSLENLRLKIARRKDIFIVG